MKIFCFQLGLFGIPGFWSKSDENYRSESLKMSTFCICSLFVTIYPQFTFYHQDEVWNVCNNLYMMLMHGGVFVFVFYTNFEVRKGNTASLESEIPQIYSWYRDPAGFGLVIMIMMILLLTCAATLSSQFICANGIFSQEPPPRDFRTLEWGEKFNEILFYPGPNIRSSQNL